MTAKLASIPQESPPSSLRLVLDASGAVVSTGRVDFVPGDGQRVIEVPDDHYTAFVAVADKLADGEEVAYDEGTGTFGKRARVKTQAEQQEVTDKGARATRLARLDADIAGYAGLTATERAAATLNGLVVLRNLVRRLLAE